MSDRESQFRERITGPQASRCTECMSEMECRHYICYVCLDQITMDERILDFTCKHAIHAKCYSGTTGNTIKCGACSAEVTFDLYDNGVVTRDAHVPLRQSQSQGQTTQASWSQQWPRFRAGPLPQPHHTMMQPQESLHRRYVVEQPEPESGPEPSPSRAVTTTTSNSNSTEDDDRAAQIGNGRSRARATSERDSWQNMSDRFHLSSRDVNDERQQMFNASAQSILSAAAMVLMVAQSNNSREAINMVEHLATSLDSIADSLKQTKASIMHALWLRRTELHASRNSSMGVTLFNHPGTAIVMRTDFPTPTQNPQPTLADAVAAVGRMREEGTLRVVTSGVVAPENNGTQFTFIFQ